MKNYNFPQIFPLVNFFNPKNIAIIGASREEEKPGYVITKILLDNKNKGLIKGKIYPINPFAKRILNLECYPTVLEVPTQIDLAIIIVPAKIVPKVLDECGRKNIKAVIIITAGFSEIGNKELEDKVIQIAKKYNIRILGPNCIGVLVPETGMDTIFLPVYKQLKDGRFIISTPRPKPGKIVLLSQSGAFLTAAIDYMYGEKIGLRAAVSYGNKADIDEADLLDYFEKDTKTRAIIMYIESLDRGRKVVEIAQKVSLKKPVITLKAGRTKAGSRAAISHTAALTGKDEIYQAAFRRAGIIRAETIEDLFDIAKAVAMQPPAKGNRVGIITDGGGAGVITTDACEFNGLQVPQLSGETLEKLKELKEKSMIPPFASILNPIDLTGSATTEMYLETTRIMLESDQVDMLVILALHQVPGIEDPVELASRLASQVRIMGYPKPVVAVDTGGSEAAHLMRETFDENNIPAYPTPERAVQALRGLYEYGVYLKRKNIIGEYLKNWEPLV